MNPRDITQMLERGIEAASHWSPARAGEVLERLRASVAQAEIDWDRDSGERWGRLLVEGQPLVAVSTLVPVAFIQTPVNAQLFALFEKNGVVAIATSNWEQHELKVDPEIAKKAFCLSDWSAAVDPEEFSAAELWWMTV